MTDPTLTLTLGEFCDRINVKRSYGTQLRNEGRLVIAPDGKRVLVQASIDRIEATRDPSKAGVAARHAEQRGAPADTGHQVDAPAAAASATEATDATDPAAGLYDFQSSKAKREHWAAEREHAQYRKEAGELIERSVHVAAFASLGALLRAKLEGWAAILPPQLVGRDEAGMAAAIAEQVEYLLGDISAAAQRQAQAEQGDAP
ncbi:hypothetical protein PSQ39_21380 [Curvibacter sp. HBC28]|uniref:Terminase small subunit n=1 Tax=Curvibacter microcysteis TaxID=3026419 RepID=A0ABT5MPN9_9BURK|nr:hypothetical protein [Curvibacter sp. HBC28]MDD0817201.1 hypothetical protein [Curvibacter sp. HBC28]